MVKGLKNYKTFCIKLILQLIKDSCLLVAKGITLLIFFKNCYNLGIEEKEH